MNASLQTLLTAALQDKETAGEQQQAPLTADERTAFENRVAQMLAYSLPQAYVDILSQTDGLDCNGVVLYASRSYQESEGYFLQGFLEANILLRDYLPNRNFVYFAESGMDFYRHNLETGLFEISARIGGAVFESFKVPEELFSQVLRHMLGEYGDDTESATE